MTRCRFEYKSFEDEVQGQFLSGWEKNGGFGVY
jgi:hypothetical protein